MEEERQNPSMDESEEGEDDVALLDDREAAAEIVLTENDQQNADLDEDMDETPAEPEEGNKAPAQDDSVVGFLGHKDSVFCVAVHPFCDLNANVNTIAVTGGGDEHAYIWNITTGTTLFELKGHKDSVVSVGFNFNGNLIATGSYDATVKVWETSTGNLLFTLDGPQNEIEWVQWHAKGNVVLAGSRDGLSWMWNTVDGKCMSVFAGHEAPVTCGTFSQDGKLVVTGSEDMTVRIWDPKTGQPAHVIRGPKFHTGPITSVDTHPSNLVVSGAQDGEARLSNMTTGKLLGNLSGHDDSVEAVAFSLVAPFIATGSLDSKVNIYDLSTLQIRGTCKHDDAVTRLIWHPTQPFVFSSSVDQTVRLWDGRSAQVAKVWRGHHNSVLDFALTKDGSYFISASDDQAALVFKV
eukprot:TRINITY_DN7415_c0_g1_i1.p1 TRINITY_DN7415_c0_g1~~TRINITY_DN7415_c0_g1_i1.p1  ORF type:complete len:407 (-),score=71.29 TRINITY_DN7415_c0_g1_i1:180-1400(-)